MDTKRREVVRLITCETFSLIFNMDCDYCYFSQTIRFFLCFYTATRIGNRTYTLYLMNMYYVYVYVYAVLYLSTDNTVRSV